MSFVLWRAVRLSVLFVIHGPQNTSNGYSYRAYDGERGRGGAIEGAARACAAFTPMPHQAPLLTGSVVLQLSSVGVPENCMAFTHVTMQSEKFVCVRETGTTNNVVIMDMANPTAPMRKPITADSTILAPSSRVLALKAQAPGEGGTQGDNLQVFNLDTKQKVRAYVNPVKVQFWTWISDETIALITDTACFHWAVNVSSLCPVHMLLEHDSASPDASD